MGKAEVEHFLPPLRWTDTSAQRHKTRRYMLFSSCTVRC
jgi:hypothetical protein